LNPKILRRLVLIIVVLFVTGLSACVRTSLTSPSPTGIGFIHTVAAQTIEAYATTSANQTAIAPLTQTTNQFQPTSTPLTPLTSEEVPTSTSILPTDMPAAPTLTPLPTYPPIWPTATRFQPTQTRRPSYPTPAPPVIPCNWAQFVNDITIPDGTVIPTGANFTKVWRIRNIGSCPWNPQYQLVFSGGERLSARTRFSLPGIVYPGNSINLKVKMAAPNETGRYRGYWMLSNANAKPFGIGINHNKAFWVDIRVVNEPRNVSFDFTQKMCAANWHNGDKKLPCPGYPSNQNGSVVLLKKPVIENGKRKNAPALWTRPKVKKNGWINGTFPKYKVRSRDHFVADIGCLESNPECDVVFSLSALIEGKVVTELGTWRQKYDGKITHVSVDLRSLRGKTVQFILSVNNNGNPSQANAFWLEPVIRQDIEMSDPRRSGIPAPLFAQARAIDAIILPATR